MTDDTGWSDFGAYGGGENLGHPTPNIDRIAKEGAVFTSPSIQARRSRPIRQLTSSSSGASTGAFGACRR